MQRKTLTSKHNKEHVLYSKCFFFNHRFTLWTIIASIFIFITNFIFIARRLVDCLHVFILIYTSSFMSSLSSSSSLSPSSSSSQMIFALSKLYSQSMSSVPAASGLINSWMEKWFGLSIQESIHKMNDPVVKLDLDSIIQCWFGLWTKSTCSLFLSVAFNRIGFPFPTVYDCVNWQKPRIEIHQSPHIHWPQFDHRVTLITGSKMAYM